jgi:tRNA(Arg) A34 adenosine deaminase TadA
MSDESTPSPAPGHVPLLLEAVATAAASRAAGHHPFGALLADGDGTVLLSAQNTVTTGPDATGHAETNLVRLASGTYDEERLATTTMYTSTEPCAMCAGAVYWSGIGRVVYAVSEIELYEMTGADPRNRTLLLPCREVFARGSRTVEVVGPVELPEARDVHAGFWAPAEG